MTEPDEVPSSTPAALLTLVDGAHLDGGACLYSLIDGAQLVPATRIRLLASGDVQCHSLLGESARHDAMYAGPLLLRHVKGLRCEVLPRLLAIPGSAHFLSLLISHHPFAELRDRLTWLTDVAHEDGTEWVMRYYDVRILPHWLEVLSETQRAISLAYLAQWLFIDAQGQVQQVDVGRGAVMAPFEGKPMLLNERQCAQLLERTLPYMLMNQLLDDDVHSLTAVPEHQRYGFFAQQLAKASGYGLTGIADLKIYCWMAIMYGADFDMTPLAAEVLEHGFKEAPFSERVLAWTPQQWAALEQKTLL